MNNNASVCPFCRKNKLLTGDLLAQTDEAYLIENAYHPGNYLVIPEKHITSVKDLPQDWWVDITKMLNAIPGLSKDYNISLNIGALAGQTQPHLHFWVIPRTANSVGSGKGLVGLLQLLEMTN